MSLFYCTLFASVCVLWLLCFVPFASVYQYNAREALWWWWTHYAFCGISLTEWVVFLCVMIVYVLHIGLGELFLGATERVIWHHCVDVVHKKVWYLNKDCPREGINIDFSEQNLFNWQITEYWKISFFSYQEFAIFVKKYIWN